MSTNSSFDGQEHHHFRRWRWSLACASNHDLASASAGLVPFSTSEKCHLVDSQAARLARMKSGVMTATRLITSELETIKGIRYRPWMITPTYRPGVEYSPRHISSLIDSLRKWATRHDFTLRYVWVAEIQEKRFNKGGSLLGECVHYHLLVWVPARLTPPKPDKQGWWRHGMTQRTLVNKPISYMLKYSKGELFLFHLVYGYMGAVGFRILLVLNVLGGYFQSGCGHFGVLRIVLAESLVVASFLGLQVSGGLLSGVL